MSATATAIAIFDVDEVDRDRVLAWQSELDTEAAKQTGFVDSHFTRGFEKYDDWAAAVTFTSEPHLRPWLGSSARVALLVQGEALGARTRDTIILLPGEQPPTGVGGFLHRVSPADHVGFLQAEAALNRAALPFTGYLGGLVLAPSDPTGAWIAGHRCVVRSSGMPDRWSAVQSIRLPLGVHRMRPPAGTPATPRLRVRSGHGAHSE